MNKDTNKNNARNNRGKEIQNEWIGIGIWNIGTLSGKEIELAEEMDKNNLQILGISETKKKGKGSTRLTNNYILHYSGVAPEQRAKEGVGIITTEEINKRISEVRTINSRIVAITLKLEETVNIIQIYAPVEGTTEEEMADFYSNLQQLQDEMKEENQKTIIMGDWNSRVGKDQNRGMGCMGCYGENIQNRNGLKMIDFCVRNELLIGNTLWNQPLEDKYTFVAEERGAKSIIDYITYTQDLAEKLQITETKIEAEIGTQHRLVTTKYHTRLTNKQEGRKYSKLAINKLKNAERREKYQKDIDEELQSKENRQVTWTIEERWTTFKETLKKAAEKTCGTRKHNKHTKMTSWWTEEIRKMVKEKKTAWKRYIQTKDMADKEEYKRRRNVVKESIKVEKRNSWRKMGEEITELHKMNTREFWTRIKRLRGDKRKNTRAIKNNQGQMQTDTKEILDTWKNYYENMYNTTVDPEENAIQQINMEQTIKREEVEDAIQKIKIGKASGEDDLSPEMLKWMGQSGTEWFWKICRQVWEEQKLPKDWENNLIVPIYKKGLQSQCENYRPICLAQTSFKIYTRILEKRLRNHIEPILEEEQAAFRQNRQTGDNIYIIRSIIERKIEEGEELYLTFIDLKAAFDTVDRSEIWRTLKELKVDKNLIGAIRSSYRTVMARVQLEGQRSEMFEMKKGIKQGDSLSPLLFIIIMDKIIKRIKEKYSHLDTVIGYKNLEAIKLNSLLYADDVVLISNTRGKMQKLVNAWTTEIENIKMEVNINKTKTMIVNEKQKEDQNNKDIKCKNKKLERVTTFEFLGSMITEDGKIDAELANRANKSSRIYYTMNKTILGHKDIDLEVKKKIYNMITLPTITYASESWTLRKKDEIKINAIEMKHLRRMAGKTKWDRVRNEDIREIIKQEPIQRKIKKRQLNWFAHTTRMEPSRIARRLMEAGKPLKKRRGRPRKKWLDQIEEIAAEKGVTLEEVRTIARDRKRWRNWIRD